MAQADGVVANGTGSAVRSDINGQYAALWSNHSGSTEPSSGKVAYQFWADTNTNILKIRNSANNSWISLFTLAGGIDVDAASNFNEDVTFTGASYNLVWDKSDNALEFADNAKCTFGTGGDLEIYHDGSTSRLHSASDSLYIRTGNIFAVYDGAGNEEIIRGIQNGAVELYFDGSKKLETTSSGVTVYTDLVTTGDVDPSADGGGSLGSAAKSWYNLFINNDIHVADNGVIQVGDGNDFQIYHDGSSNDSYINSSGNDIYLRLNGSENSAKFIKNGGVELFYDDVLKLATSSAGLNVTGDSSNYDTIKLEAQSAGGDPSISFGRYGFSTTSRGAAIKYEYVTANTQEQGHLDFYTNPSYNSTGSLNQRFRISDNGDLYADNTTINQFSDSRLKKNIADYTYDLAKFKQLKPKTFDWINPEEHIRDTSVRGFIAQEVQPIDAYYIKESTFGNKKDKELITDGKGLTSSLGANDAMYVSVINQLIAKIETLETKVAALEAK